MQPNVVRLFAECAAGKRVLLITPGGREYALPIVPEPEQPPAPSPLDVLMTTLLERDSETRAAVARSAARSDESLNAIKVAVAEVVAGQDKVAESVGEMTATMAQPVTPIYDADGKLVGARREKLKGA